MQRRRITASHLSMLGLSPPPPPLRLWLLCRLSRAGPGESAAVGRLHEAAALCRSCWKHWRSRRCSGWTAAGASSPCTFSPCSRMPS